jgi:hypothetical protein
MPLQGEAKKLYQRNYMRKRRAKPLDPLTVLDQVNKTLDDSRQRLDTVNKNIEEVIKVMTEEPLDPNEAEEKSKETQTSNTGEFQGDVIVTGLEQAAPGEPIPYCGACHGRGWVELDTIGLVTGPCPVCKGRTQL